ncbi:unnamed protein product [Pleuronectes platessa]|uniref:Uncharacterized protein n=1 Tax=Pleuronectes platessa TaxID=8262 RepID=A0A9N7UNL5_PLEPL|nr:unnamed protein product [Pleuronectes platessa]
MQQINPMQPLVSLPTLPSVSTAQHINSWAAGQTKSIERKPQSSWSMEDHLNWAPGPPDPTAFKLNGEKGPQFPRGSPEEERGGVQLSAGFSHRTPFSGSKGADQREGGQRSHQPTLQPAFL